MNRRQALGLVGSVFAVLAWPKLSEASTARAVSLQDLVQRSTRIVRGTPLDSVSQSEDVGGTRHIVTYSRLRVEDPIRDSSGDSEIWVRTLGGRVGELGEIVHGEAELALNETCLVFLRKAPEGVEQVTAMAQGHYPMALDAAGTPRLLPSRNMPHLLGGPLSAVAQLKGLPFGEARSLILGVRR